MTGFVVVGVIGVALLAVSLLFGNIIDGLFDSVDLGGGILSTEVVGAFLAAFGFGAALLSAGLSTSLGVALAGGVAAGVGTGGVALVISRSFLRMPTDATPGTRHLAGRLGRVITRIPPDGMGEVAVTVGGHRMKLSATADQPIAAGSDVVIVAATSSTSVIVTEARL